MEMTAALFQLDGKITRERHRLRREVRSVIELGWIFWRIVGLGREKKF